MQTPESNYEKLNQLIEMGYMEFILSDDICRLVYMMNDSAESFLVLHEHIITGNFDPSFSDIEYAELTEDERGCLLLVRQDEDHAFSVRFQDISLEVHLFNYAKIGHFWVEEYEYLRQIEYHIAILRDKYRYLGPDYCTPEEIQLSLLDAFPPLLLYPSAPARYWHRENLWRADPEAISFAASLAREVKDQKLYAMIKKYSDHPDRWRAKLIARALHRTNHQDFVRLLWKKISDAASVYPDRSFGKEADDILKHAYDVACSHLSDYEKEGIYAIVLKEEPFLYGEEHKDYKIHMMLMKNHRSNTVSHIITYDVI